jgi:hypothetical protein
MTNFTAPSAALVLRTLNGGTLGATHRPADRPNVHHCCPHGEPGMICNECFPAAPSNSRAGSE